MDPRPTFDAGQITLYAVGVLAALPVVAIPLDGYDTATLDLQAAYNRSFDVLVGFHRLLDYSALPANATAYTSADRKRLQKFVEDMRQ
jgi:hypothetical protein